MKCPRNIITHLTFLTVTIPSLPLIAAVNEGELLIDYFLRVRHLQVFHGDIDQDTEKTPVIFGDFLLVDLKEPVGYIFFFLQTKVLPDGLLVEQQTGR